MKLLGSTKKVVDKDRNEENVPKLEIVEVVLVHCNLVKNDYQQTSKVLFTFVRSLEVKKFSYAEVWFTDQLSKRLEIEDNVNLTLIIG